MVGCPTALPRRVVSETDRRVGRATFDPLQLARTLRVSYAADLGDIGAFLPSQVPPTELPFPFGRYLAACSELPTRYAGEGSGVRRWLDREFATVDPAVSRGIHSLNGIARAALMTALSALGHTYRWDRIPPAPERFTERRIHLPPGLGEPWTELARVLDQPRVGTTWSLHLCNWTLADGPGRGSYRPDELHADNLRLAHNWLHPPVDAHLERFSLSFVLLEARGAAILRHIVDAVEAAASNLVEAAMLALAGLRSAIEAMTLCFSVNVRKRTVDPAVWLKLVQPTFAWSAEESGTGAMEGGPSGMQVAIVQALDAALVIGGYSALAQSAKAGRRLMPKPHRRFLHALDASGPVLRRFVLDTGCDELTEHYNACIRSVVSFRSTHHSRGALYLRNRPDDGAARVSTGLTIGLNDDPLAVFDRTMSERTGETRAAALSPATALLSQIGEERLERRR